MTQRHAKGVNLIHLVKMLKIYRRQRPLTGLSADAEALLGEHILATKWYRHELFLELLEVTFRQILNGDEEKAVAAGITGGRLVLQDIHKAFVQQGDPIGSVMAMRHTWPTYFDFADIKADLAGNDSVRFAVAGYPDIPMVHALTTIGWGIAAARLAGAKRAGYLVEDRPWEGAPMFRYRIDLDGNG